MLLNTKMFWGEFIKVFAATSKMWGEKVLVSRVKQLILELYITGDHSGHWVVALISGIWNQGSDYEWKNGSQNGQDNPFYWVKR